MPKLVYREVKFKDGTTRKLTIGQMLKMPECPDIPRNTLHSRLVNIDKNNRLTKSEKAEKRYLAITKKLNKACKEAVKKRIRNNMHIKEEYERPLPTEMTKTINTYMRVPSI